jgi:hypothetical protein
VIDYIDERSKVWYDRQITDVYAQRLSVSVMSAKVTNTTIKPYLSLHLVIITLIKSLINANQQLRCIQNDSYFATIY